MKQYFPVLLILLSFVGNHCEAQLSDAKYKEFFGKADGYVYDGNFSKALPLLEELYLQDSTNSHINYLLGVTYLNTFGKKNQAVSLLEKAINNVKLDHKDGDVKDKSAPGLAYYYLAKAYHSEYKFDDAITNYFNYRSFISMDNYTEYSEVKRQIEAAENGKTLMENPVDVRISVLDINSKWDDFSPVISPDGTTLIFTSRREGSTGAKLTREGKFHDDIYVSKLKDGKWSTPKSIGAGINSDGHEASTSISANGKQLLVYKDENNDGNLFYSNLNGDLWSTLIKLGSTINTKSWETHACFSPDGNKLYFTSNKQGGVGGRDIYYSQKLPTGEWGIAKNLGKSVNSPFDEDAPFVSADGNKLYFSSRGHMGMGGFDIMYCAKNDTGWGEVQNIGYPINSPENDIFYVETTNKKTAYFSSQRPDGLGGLDIFKITYQEEIPDKIEPTVAILKGKVTVSDTQKGPDNASIVVTKKSNNDLVGVYKPNSADGDYLISLQSGESYIVSFENNGYLERREEVDFPLEKGSQEIIRDITLKKSPSLVADAEKKAIAENKVVDKVVETNSGTSEVEYSVNTDYSKYMKQQGKEDLAVTEAEAQKAKAAQPQESDTDAALRKRKEELLAEIQKLKGNKTETTKPVTETDNAANQAATEAKVNEENKAKIAKEQALAEARAKAEAAAKLEEERKREMAKKAAEAEAKAAIAYKEQEEQKKLAALQKEKAGEEAKHKASTTANAETSKSNETALAGLMNKLEVKKADEASSYAEYEKLKAQSEEANETAIKKSKEAASAQKALETASQQASNAKEVADLQAKKAAEQRAKALANEKALEAEKAKASAEQKALDTKAAQIEAENAIKMAKLGLKDGEEISAAILEAEQKLRSKESEESLALKALKEKEDEIKKLRADAEKIKQERARAAAESKELEILKQKEEQRIKLESEAKEREEAQKVAAEKLRAETEARNAQIAADKKAAQEKAAEEKRKAAELKLAAKIAAREKAVADSIAKIQQKLAYEAKLKADREKKEKEQYELRVQYESGEANKTIQTQKHRIEDLESDNRLLREEMKELASKVQFLTKELEYQKSRLSSNQISINSQPNISAEKNTNNSNYGNDDDFSTLLEGKKIILRNIYFDYDKSFLRRESFPELNKLYNYLVSHPDLTIEIGGHSDSKGSEKYNQSLSRDRAASVLSHLTSKGILGKRLKAVGYGPSEPIAPNTKPDGSDNPSGRQQNRRIEIKVIK